MYNQAEYSKENMPIIPSEEQKEKYNFYKMKKSFDNVEHPQVKQRKNLKRGRGTGPGPEVYLKK